ncbi:MAG: hypothetical protein M3Y21_06695, partial [Candidatus Eremiobacteraeota bacterium]|nr:hypothetical protein [Candidatus Eremiobacteraeota bacterium]
TNGEPGRNLGRALVGFELPHQAGSLHEALGKLADKSLNLRNLVARPSRHTAFEYTFYIEFDCADKGSVAEIARALSPTSRIYGVY